MRPGGLLAAPLVAAPARDDASHVAAFRARLASWDIPLRTPAELAAELRDAGFTDPRIVRSPLGRSLLVRRP